MVWPLSGPKSSRRRSTSFAAPTDVTYPPRRPSIPSPHGDESMTEPRRVSGVMPANILPFTADLAIDEPAYRRHLSWLADTRGVTGIVANGHAAEISSLTREERQRALAIAMDEIAGRCPVIAGVY